MCRASVAPVLIAYSSASALLSAIVLTVFCRRSGLLLQRLWSESLLSTFLLWRIRPSHCRQRPECLVLLQLFVFWLLVSRTACSVEFPWCTWVGVSVSVGLLLLAVSMLLRVPLLQSQCLALCMSSIVVCQPSFGRLHVLLCWVLVPSLKLLSECCCLVLVLGCSWACWLLPTPLLCSDLLGWSRSSHLCCRCFCPKSWWCCRLWALLLDVVKGVAECSWTACWPSPVDQWKGGRPRSIGCRRLLQVLRRRWAHSQGVVVPIVASPLLGDFAKPLDCCVVHIWLCWAARRSGHRRCKTLLVDT